MIFALYSLLLRPSAGFLRHLLARRMARGKEDPARVGERRGEPGLPRPAGQLIWLHAASVGESISLLSLLDILRERRPDLALLMTTGTVTSARLMAGRLPPGILHQFIPLDHPAWVAQFLDHWRPDMVIWSESELWPNMLDALRRRKIAAVLVNARMSAQSFQRWKAVRGFAARVLSVFSLCLAQTETEAERLRQLGAAASRTAGNLKYAAAPLPDAPGARMALQATIGARPAVLWASTHPGEEMIARRVHLQLRKKIADVLTIIVPRHAVRGAELKTSLSDDNIGIVRRSEGGLPDAATGIYIADTMGELGLFYRLCKTVVMGGSFANIGGHNPIEPGQLGAVIVCGPQMYNFAAIREDFRAAKALLEVETEAQLVPLLLARLQNPAAYDAIGAAAASCTAAQSQVLARIYNEVQPFLPPKTGTEACR